jgi:hypothetical protein
LTNLIQKKFIKKVGQSGLSFLEIACISGIPQITLFKFAGGDIDLSPCEKSQIAAILGCKVDELFPLGRDAANKKIGESE